MSAIAQLALFEAPTPEPPRTWRHVEYMTPAEIDAQENGTYGPDISKRNIDEPND